MRVCVFICIYVCEYVVALRVATCLTNLLCIFFAFPSHIGARHKPKPRQTRRHIRQEDTKTPKKLRNQETKTPKTPKTLRQDKWIGRYTYTTTYHILHTTLMSNGSNFYVAFLPLNSFYIFRILLIYWILRACPATYNTSE